MKNATNSATYLQIPSNYQQKNVYPEIPEDISQRLNAVPLWADNTSYTIATSDSNFQDIHEIESIVKKAVRVFLTTYPQIQTIQSQLYTLPDPIIPKLDKNAISRLLGITSEDTLKVQNQKQQELGLSFSEKIALEIMGLQKDLPHIDLRKVSINRFLSPLVPFQMAKENHVIPLWWMKTQLVLGCNMAAPLIPIKQLAELFSFNVQLVLCSEKQWKSAFRSIYLEGEKGQIVTDEDIIFFLVENNLIEKSDLTRAEIFSSQYNLPVLRSLLDMNLITEPMLIHARSKLMNIPEIDTSIQPQKEYLNQIPAEIAQNLRIIPFAADQGKISIASDQFDIASIKLIESLTNLEAEPFLISQRILEEWLFLLYLKRDILTQDITSLSLGEVLITTGYISLEQLDQVRKSGAFLNHRLAEQLISLGFLDDADLATALSLQTGLPAISLDHSNIDSSLIKTFPNKIAETYQIIPLYQQDDTLWVGSADPFNGRGFHQIKERLGLDIRPVVVPQKVLWAIIEQNWGVSYHRLTKDVYLTIQKLIERDFLTQTQANDMSQMLSSQGLLFDEAFIQSSYYSPAQSTQILANLFDVPVFDINLTEKQREQIDGIGNPVKHLYYQDPVEPSIATLIDFETAKKYCLLPIRKEGKQIVIAFANPLAIFNQKMFEELLEAPIKPVLSIRSDLVESIERNLGHKNIGSYLLENNIITRRNLNEALELSEKTGVRLGQALLINQTVKEGQIYELLAEQANLAYVNLEDYEIDEEAARLINPEIERELGILPINATEESITLAIVDPINTETLKKAEALTEKIVYPVVTSELALEKAFERLYSTDYTIISTSNLLQRSPRESAFKVLSKGQSIFLVAFIILSIIWMIMGLASYVITMNVLVTIFYLGFSAYKFYLIYHAMNHDNEVPISQEELDALQDKDLPMYTLLIPVYKEAEVLPELMKALTHIDYPSTKLDIKILMEADDTETIDRFNELGLPPHFKGIVVPGSQPKTKPKACNYGLIHARGEYVVIFDAEDLPETDQLKKAVVAFQKSNPDVVCIQAKLNYYNRTQNLLTRWFTVEYSMWFDLFLPGLDASEAPIPLGGTSNHFKRRALAEVGAWDPHNVTEDADLGMRLYKRGYHTRTIDSTTYEEANSNLKNWIRQRSRWIKGYIQTWLVHMRNPIKLYREVGLKGFVSFQFVAGGTFFAALVNPLLWTITTIWFLTEWAFIQETFPGIIFYLGSLNLYLGNFVFTYMNVAGAMRRKHYDNVRYALLSPVYWGLMSIGAWKGFLQLLTKPHYWEKTIHGLGQTSSNISTDHIQSAEEDNNDQ